MKWEGLKGVCEDWLQCFLLVGGSEGVGPEVGGA